jgi:Zn-dependent protease/CBS domain-containing protein
MKASISLGRWFGVPVGLHYSWFIIAWLITLSLTGQFAAMNPGWSRGFVWGLALFTAALFFVSIVLHELGHATVARLSGMPVRGITLFALGGVAHIEKEASTPAKEFWMAIAGPAVSVVIGIVCTSAAAALGFATNAPAPSGADAVLGWLGYINIALALFNLIPAFPLDGGRVLRSIIWGVSHNADRATRAAARVGQFVAFLFIAGGIFSALVQRNFGGLWIAFIGWFLLEAAQGYYQQTQLTAMLRGVRVGDVMAHDCVAIPAEMSLRDFVDRYLLHQAGRCYVVNRDGHTAGLIGAEDVKRLDRGLWEHTAVGHAMRPIQSLHPLRPDAEASEALTVMMQENIPQLPVVSGGHLEGVVTMSYLARLLHARQELGA